MEGPNDHTSQLAARGGGRGRHVAGLGLRGPATAPRSAGHRAQPVADVARGHALAGDPRRATRQEAIDQAQLPTAELRDAYRVFSYRHHAERRLFRSLSPLQHSPGRRQDLESCRRGGRCERPSGTHPRRSQANADGRGRGREPMLGQPSRPVPAACRRRGMGLRRHGLRALERGAAQGSARQGRPQEGGDRDRLRRCRFRRYR